MDRCLSQVILDGGNGFMTMKLSGFDCCETVESVSDRDFPEVVEIFAMLHP